MPRRFASSLAKRSMSNHAGLQNSMRPAGMPSETSKICAPPMPAFAMASRSAVMPAFVTLPFIQCHHTCGRAEAGGSAKPSSRASPPRAASESPHAASVPAIRGRGKVLKVFMRHIIAHDPPR